MGTIKIKNIRIWSTTGWYKEELLVANEFSVSLQVNVPVQTHVKHLSSTVDYAQIAAIVKRVFQQAPPLLEQINEQIAEEVFRSFQIIDKLSVKVEKLHPNIGVNAASVSYSRKWTRLRQ